MHQIPMVGGWMVWWSSTPSARQAGPPAFLSTVIMTDYSIMLPIRGNSRVSFYVGRGGGSLTQSLNKRDQGVLPCMRGEEADPLHYKKGQGFLPLVGVRLTHYKKNKKPEKTHHKRHL